MNSNRTSATASSSDGSNQLRGTMYAAGDLLRDATPFVLIGGMFGASYYALKRAFASSSSSSSSGSSSAREIPNFLKSQTAIHGDASVEVPLKQIELLCKVCPKLLAPYVTCINTLCQSWYTTSDYLRRATNEMYKITDKAELDAVVADMKTLMNAWKLKHQAASSSPGKYAGSSASVDGGVKIYAHGDDDAMLLKMMQLYIDDFGRGGVIDNMLSNAAYAESALNNNGTNGFDNNNNNSHQFVSKLAISKTASKILTLSVVVKLLEYSAIVDSIKKHALESLPVIKKMQTGMKKYFKMYEIYWDSVGDTFMLDPSLMTPQDANSCRISKLNVVQLLMTDGKLLVNPMNIVEETERTKEYIKWWTYSHTRCLPTMHCVASVLHWSSPYNPIVDKNVHHGMVKKIASSSSDKDNNNSNNNNNFDDVLGADGRRMMTGSKHIQPGHSFLSPFDGDPKKEEEFRKKVNSNKRGNSKSKNNAEEGEDDGFENAGADNILKQDPVGRENEAIKLVRPSANSSLKDLFTFWQSRWSIEGASGLIQHPTAGLVPSTNEPSFLPTVAISSKDGNFFLNRITDAIGGKIAGVAEDLMAIDRLLGNAYNHLLSLGGEDEYPSGSTLFKHSGLTVKQMFQIQQARNAM